MQWLMVVLMVDSSTEYWCVIVCNSCMILWDIVHVGKGDFIGFEGGREEGDGKENYKTYFAFLVLRTYESRWIVVSCGLGVTESLEKGVSLDDLFI